MIQTDIILDTQSREFSISIGELQGHNVCLDSGDIRANVTVTGLITQQELYGDELLPIIMYLQTGAEFGATIFVLGDTIFDSIDSKLLSELDGLTFFELNHPVSQLSLQCNSFDISNGLSLAAETNDLRLIAQAIAAQMATELKLLSNVQHLSTSGVLTDIVFAILQELDVIHLNNSMTENAQLVVYLELIYKSLSRLDSYTIGELDDELLSDLALTQRGSRLTQSTIDLDNQSYIYFENGYLVLETGIEAGNFWNRNYLNNPPVFSMGMSVEIPFVTADNLEPVDCSLALSLTVSQFTAQSKIVPMQNNLAVRTGLDYQYFLSSYDYFGLSELDTYKITELDEANDCIHLYSNFQPEYTMMLQTTGSVVIEPSVDYYKDTLLSSMDNYLLSELEAEL